MICSLLFVFFCSLTSPWIKDSSLGFLYLYFSGARQVGIETMGAPIWWTNFRIFHGIMYLLFAFYAINKNVNAYKFIIVDTFAGLTLFLIHHYNAGSFAKL